MATHADFAKRGIAVYVKLTVSKLILELKTMVHGVGQIVPNVLGEVDDQLRISGDQGGQLGNRKGQVRSCAGGYPNQFTDYSLGFPRGLQIVIRRIFSGVRVCDHWDLSFRPRWSSKISSEQVLEVVLLGHPPSVSIFEDLCSQKSDTRDCIDLLRV